MRCYYLASVVYCEVSRDDPNLVANLDISAARRDLKSGVRYGFCYITFNPSNTDVQRCVSTHTEREQAHTNPIRRYEMNTNFIWVE